MNFEAAAKLCLGLITTTTTVCQLLLHRAGLILILAVILSGGSSLPLPHQMPDVEILNQSLHCSLVERWLVDGNQKT